jgi:hypothetical protein
MTRCRGNGTDGRGHAPAMDAERPRRWMAPLIFLLAWAHGMLWATIVPPWQAPDEPLHYEYACLLGERQHLLTPADTSQELQAGILESMAAHRFWEFLGGQTPHPQPTVFAEAQDFWLSQAGTQVTDEPPLYYLIAAALCRWLPGIELRLWAMRAYSALLSAGVVLLGWLTAKELWPGDGALQLTTAALLGLQPMATFVGASANNDALANLGGAALAWSLARGATRGWSWKRVLGLIGIAVVLPLSKKSGLFALPLTLVVLSVAGCRRLPRRRRWAAGAGLAGLALATALVGYSPVAGQAEAWGRRGTVRYDARSSLAAHSGAWALTVPALPDGHAGWLVQTVPSNALGSLRDEEVALGLWVRATATGQALITVDDGRSESMLTATAGTDWQFFAMRHRVAVDASRLRVMLAPAPTREGRPELFFDDVSLLGAGQELVQNGSAELVKRRWEGWTAGYLRLPLWYGKEVLDRRSYDVASLRRYGQHVAVTFANFWGDFGWLTLPLPLGLYVVPALSSLGAAVGWIWVRRSLPQARQRQALLWLTMQGCLVLVLTFLPMIGRTWQPQGRYLFPALIPWAIFFVLGWRGWGQRFSWRTWWTVPVLGVALLDLVGLFAVVAPHYYG